MAKIVYCSKCGKEFKDGYPFWYDISKEIFLCNSCVIETKKQRNGRREKMKKDKMNTTNKGQKYQVVNKNCSNYGDVLTIDKVVTFLKGDNPEDRIVYYREALGKEEKNTRAWWIKTHCELLGTSERQLLQIATNFAKEYQDKLQKAENKSGYLDPDIDAMNNFIDWLTNKNETSN